MYQTGPKTASGKRISSLNSLRHGIFTQHILLCKKERCFYASICPLLQDQHNGRRELLKIGDKCPVEEDYYCKLVNDFKASHPEVGTQLTEREENIIMTMLQIRRAQMLISLDPEIVRSIPSKFPGYTRPALSLGIRYRIELGRRLFKEITQLCDENQHPPVDSNTD